MEYYAYVSTRACYDPARTIFVFAPQQDAATLQGAARFARTSGWQALAEYDGAVLIVPVAPQGWQAEPDTLPSQLFDQVRNRFASRCGKSLLGRRGMLWCWETMVYWVGYGEGAAFAGRCAAAAPNRFAAAALVGGAAADYSAGRRPSDHWLVKHVSEGYHSCNDDIPACLWLLDVPPEDTAAAVRHYAGVNGFDPKRPTPCQVGGIPALRYAADGTTAAQLLISDGPCPQGPALVLAILNGLFDHVIRWKNGPDGTLARISGRPDFYSNGRFEMTSVTVNCLEYACAVHLPQGMSKEQVRGLPLVFTVHGRGEPAWLFAEKNGWDTLADETRAFVLAAPDSPGNIWQAGRDADAFGALIDHLCQCYGLDRTRVYLTGFSNGGSITREVGTLHPEWFAAIAPFNAPVHVPDVVMDDAVAPSLEASGFELPYWVTVGDNDPAAVVDVDEQLEPLLKVNGCALRPAQGLTTRFAPDEIRTGDNWYTPERGYRQGSRFTTLVYRGQDGEVRVGYTVMKDMPHGAITEQSRACWEFLHGFRRPAGEKHVLWEAEGASC